MITAKIIQDSISPLGDRLTTFELTYPRFIHSEFMTHRVFSRNAASSRAIPVSKLIERVESNPAKVIYWGREHPGMQAKCELDRGTAHLAEFAWNKAREEAIAKAKGLSNLKVHKQIVNRLLEPFSNITVICTATEWNNFWAQRCHPDAQPEIQRLAFLMLKEYYASTPKEVYYGEWHLPYLFDDEKDLDLEIKKKLCIARAARVSYLSHDGVRDRSKDLKLYEFLLKSGHFSPFEHIATPIEDKSEEFMTTNFFGWVQARYKAEKNFIKHVPTEEEVNEYVKNL